MLHSIKVGTGLADLDHVLIGPPGVIVVNTKNHAARQRVQVCGEETRVGSRTVNHVAQIRAEANQARWLLHSAARALLDRRSAMATGAWPAGWTLRAPVSAVEMVAQESGPAVTPLLCFASNRLEVCGHPDDVRVVSRGRLAQFLEAMRPAISQSESDAIFELAARSTTWTRDIPAHARRA